MDWIPVFTYDFGVSFFFVLSGFILCQRYRDFDSIAGLRDFYVARIARVWPLHLFTLCVFFLLADKWYWNGTEGHHAGMLAANIFMVHAWIPRAEYFFAFNAVSWSISTEAFFYLVFPALRHRWSQTWHWKSLSVLLIAFLVLTVTTARGVAPFDFYNPAANSSLGWGYISPLVRIVEFVLGMLAATAFERLRNLSGGVWKWTALELCAIASIPVITAVDRSLLLSATGGNSAQSSWAMFVGHAAAAPAFALAVFIAAFGRGWISRALSIRPLTVLGEASFALYLSHQLLYNVFVSHRAMFGHRPDHVVALFYWGSAIVISLLLWALVERPARTWIRHVASRRPELPTRGLV